jgi:hypothetical protein
VAGSIFEGIVKELNPGVAISLPISVAVIFGFAELDKCSRIAFDNIKSFGKIVYYGGYKNFGYNFGWVKFEMLLNGSIQYPYTARLKYEIDINKKNINLEIRTWIIVEPCLIYININII